MKKKFICTVCGYIYEGTEAPEKCPICKAPALSLIHIFFVAVAFLTYFTTETITVIRKALNPIGYISNKVDVYKRQISYPEFIELVIACSRQTLKFLIQINAAPGICSCIESLRFLQIDVYKRQPLRASSGFSPSAEKQLSPNSPVWSIFSAKS